MSKRKGDPGYAPGWCIHYVGSPKFYESNKRHVCEAGVEHDLLVESIEANADTVEIVAFNVREIGE
jgi:hypothetical protein